MTLYFGYGSNLWLQQMRLRCPGSEYRGVARLGNFTWIIKEPGYANVISSNKSQDAQIHRAVSDMIAEQGSNGAGVQKILPHKLAESDYHDQVYGLLYSLTPADEERLDRNEGVASGAYTKEYLPVSIWQSIARDHRFPPKVDVETPPDDEDEQVLVYIDRRRIVPAEPKEEYIFRMNKGIDDALALGVPQAYVDQIMRKYIPPLEEGQDDARW